MFQFLSPLYLIGLLSAAIPLLIHLSRSRKVKTLRFSTTRFLTDQFMRSYRMSRLKELWLLALRMALFAVFAMALAQPLIMPRGGALVSGQSRAVVIVLDDSASMSYVEENLPLFERVKSAAKEIVNGLKSGDVVSVVLAGRRADGVEVLFPQPTPELGDVRQALDNAVVKELGTDLTQAVVRAEQLLRGSSHGSKEVYVLSDLQQLEASDAESLATTSDTSDVLHFFVSLRPKQPQNLGITAVQYGASRPMVGVPFALRPHVRVQGDATTCELELFIDGQKVGEQKLDGLQSDRWSVGRFFHTFERGGWHHGFVQVKDDRYPTDNRRHFAFDVVDSVKVLAVNGAPSSVGRLDELFFLKLALTAAAGGATPIQFDQTTPNAIADDQLQGRSLVILANVESLAAPTVEKLESFVDRGGSVLIFLGDQINAPFYNQTLAAEARLHGGLLPGRLSSIEGDPAGERSTAGIGDFDETHPALAALRDEQSTLFAGVQFQAFWNIEPGESAVLMRTSTGAPLLVEKSFGQGKVVLCAAPCDRDWSNFPVKPAFLPWVYRLVGYLSQQRFAPQPFHRTGDAVPIAVSALEGSPQLLVKQPDGRLSNLSLEGNATEPTFRETESIGTYEVLQTGQDKPTELFVANLDPLESDLSYFGGRTSEGGVGNEEAELKVAFPGRPLMTYLDDPTKVGDVSLVARRGIRFWDWLLWLALAFALFEPWLANRISAERYLKTKDARVTAMMSSPQASRFSSKPTTMEKV